MSDKMWEARTYWRTRLDAAEAQLHIAEYALWRIADTNDSLDGQLAADFAMSYFEAAAEDPLAEARRIFDVLSRTGPMIPVQEAAAIQQWLTSNASLRS